MEKLWSSIVLIFTFFNFSLFIINFPICNDAFADVESHEKASQSVFTQIKKLAPGDGAVGDFFGDSVAVKGDILVVGAPARGLVDEPEYREKYGAAYIYYRNYGGSDNWGQVAKLEPSDSEDKDYFGISVSIDGDTVIVGAFGNDDYGNLSGSAYIYYRNHGGPDNWGQVKKITASDAAERARFGLSVDIVENTIIVGAPYAKEDDIFTGAVYIFYRHEGGSDNWGQVKKITASDAERYAEFGRSVSIHGDTVVVGSPGNTYIGIYSGKAYLFYRNEGGLDNWGQVKKILAGDPEGTESFGSSVSISGDTVVVGDFGYDYYDPTAGAVYLFYRNKGGIDNWGRIKKIDASDASVTSRFGGSVSISEDRLVVGAPGDSEKGGNGSGSAAIFFRDAGGPDNWGLVSKLKASDAVAGDLFGTASIDGDMVVVGANGERIYSYHTGYAYVYEYGLFEPQGDWFHLGLNLWASAVLQTPGNDVALKWKETSLSDTPGRDRVIGGYFYADPADFEYGNINNPEVYAKVYVSGNGWANITFSHVTVDNVTVYSALNYSGAAQQRGIVTLKNRMVEHPYTGVISRQ